MEKSTLLWLVPVFLLIHNLEEALFFPKVQQKYFSMLPRTIQHWLPQVSYKQFLIALVIVTALPFIFIILYELKNAQSTAVYLLLVVQTTMLLKLSETIGRRWFQSKDATMQSMK
jgi:hypothetical protein